jgi:hypothetical protein
MTVRTALALCLISGMASCVQSPPTKGAVEQAVNQRLDSVAADDVLSVSIHATYYLSTDRLSVKPVFLHVIEACADEGILLFDWVHPLAARGGILDRVTTAVR